MEDEDKTGRQCEFYNCSLIHLTKLLSFFAPPYTIPASHFTVASLFITAPLCALASSLTPASSCTFTSPSQLPPPDVISLCIQALPMKYFAACATDLFPILYHLPSLSECLYTCSSITHHLSLHHSSCSLLPILPLFPSASYQFSHAFLAATP